jgi:hypothetical protein
MLLQLQSFLLDKEDSDTEEFLAYYRNTKQMMADAKASRNFACRCGHDGATAPWPYEGHWEPLPGTTPKTMSTKLPSLTPTEVKPLGSSYKPILFKNVVKTIAKPVKKKDFSKLYLLLDKLPEEVMLHVLEYIQLDMLMPVSELGPTYKSLCNSTLLWARKEMNCFHSKASFEEDVLGIGLNLEYNPKTQLLIGITTPMDLVSLSAFEDGVRKGAWNQPFKYWIPLYINREHGKRSMAIFEEHIAKLYAGHKNAGKVHIVTRVVDVLCKLMCSMVVEIMKGVTHASLRALEYYCHFHRLLIYYVSLYPEELLSVINNRIERFINDEHARSKDVTPNLGEFLPLLSVSDYCWKDVAGAVVQEVMDRNSLWIKKMHPKLANSKVPDTDRLDLSWEASHVGLHLIMFHAFFLQKVVDRSDGVTLEDMCWQYDSRFGKPTQEMQDVMQQAIFEIQDTKGYMPFFKYCQVPVKDVQEARALLRKAMANAFRRGYISTFSRPDDRRRHNEQGERRRYTDQGERRTTTEGRGRGRSEQRRRTEQVEHRTFPTQGRGRGVPQTATRGGRGGFTGGRGAPVRQAPQQTQPVQQTRQTTKKTVATNRFDALRDVDE